MTSATLLAAELDATSTPPYVASHTKRDRRTRADMDAIRAAIYRVAEADQPVTVRQVFYRLVSEGIVRKTEGEYGRTVGRLMVEMRMAGELPFGWVADSTRWIRRPDTFDSVQDALRETARTYRRPLWRGRRVEVWCEKEALAGVLVDVTYPWDVPLIVQKGYPSITYLYAIAEEIRHQGDPTVIYQFGDYDPSGQDIIRFCRERLVELAPDVEDLVTFELAALTPEQIRMWNLPSRPTKRSDTRCRDFRGESVDLDAVPPGQLRALAEECITKWIDPDLLARTKAIEDLERSQLRSFAASWS